MENQGWKRRMCLSLCIFILTFLTVIGISVKAEENFNGAIYFYSAGCSSCKKLEPFISNHEQVKKYDITTTEGNQLFHVYCEQYDIDTSERYAPIIFVNDQAFLGSQQIEANLNVLTKDDNVTPLYQVDTSVNSNNQFNLIEIFAGGFVNGLNPCSLAMFLFLISICMTNQKHINKILLMYIIGKFMTFFLLGTILCGILEFIDITLVSKVAKVVMTFLILAMIILNLNDYLNIRSNKLNKVKLQLPSRFKKKNQDWMKSIEGKAENKHILVFLICILGISILVSLTEFMCTGQVYLISIVGLLHAKEAFSLQLVAYLAVYNVAMILPLVLCVLALKKGMSIFQMSIGIQNKTHWIKFVNMIYLSIILIIILLT